MRAIAYIRQSDSRGAGVESLSIQSMETELRRWCEAEGWDLVGVIREADAKGWQDETERPGIQEALERARERSYDCLLVWSMDRFARSVRIQENLIFRLAALNVDVLSRTEPHSNQSPMVRTILGAVAEETTRTISKHIKRALRERTRQGFWHGPAPYGHRRTPDGRLEPCDGEAPVVAEIVARVALGESYLSIAHDLTARGVGNRGTAWTHRTVRTVAINPAHVGTAWAGDVRTAGAHPAIVDRATWDRCQERLADTLHRARRRNAPTTFLSGHVRCGCGLPLYPVLAWSGGRPDGKRYATVLLRCRAASNGHLPKCGQPRRSIARHAAEAFARARIAADLERATDWRATLARATARQRAAAPALVTERDRLTTARLRLEARRARLVDAYAEGIIAKAELAARVAPIDAEAAEVAARLADAPPPPDPAAYREAGAVVAALRRTVAGADDARMAGVLAALRATVVLRDGELGITYGGVFGDLLGGG